MPECLCGAFEWCDKCNPLDVPPVKYDLKTMGKVIIFTKEEIMGEPFKLPRLKKQEKGE